MLQLAGGIQSILSRIGLTVLLRNENYQNYHLVPGILMSKDLVSTKEASKLLAVSESTIRRWCDVGKLMTIRSPGGHRRVPMDAIMQLARELGLPIASLSVRKGASLSASSNLSKAAEQLCDHLCQGSEEPSVSMILSAYSSGHSILKIGDELIAPAMHGIGMQWESGSISVSIERRACHIVMNGLREIERLIPETAEERPLAMGVAPGGDFSQVGTQLVSLVLRAAGWRVVQLGAGVPFAEVSAECRTAKPDLIWLSSAHVENEQQFVKEYQQEIEPFLKSGTSVVIGGRAFSEEILDEISFSFFGKTLEALETFASGLPAHRRQKQVRA